MSDCQISRGRAAVAALAAAALVALPSAATESACGATNSTSAPETVHMLPFGNSVSFGTGSTSGGGYRKPLQELLLDDGQTLHGTFDFIGGQDNGSATLDNGQAMDPDNWARPGALAADSPRSNPFIGGAVGDPILNQDLQTSAGSVFEGGPADVILLHIGTNPLLGDTPGEPAYGNDPSNYTPQEAAGQLGNMLSTMEAVYQQDANRTDRRIAEDARIILTDILPKANSSGVEDTSDAQTVLNTHHYNNMIDAQIDSLDMGFEALFSRADMYSIPADSMLADNLRALGVTQSEIDQMVDPDDDGMVDWIEGSAGNAFDETDPMVADYGGVNTALMTSDRIHPTSLGYKVMASVWYQKLKELNRAPEPTTLVLMAAGATMVLWPRGRRAR